MDPKLLVRTTAMGALVLGVCLGCGDDRSTLSPPPPDFMQVTHTGYLVGGFDGDETDFYSYTDPHGVKALLVYSQEADTESQVWIHNFGSHEIEPGSYDLQAVSLHPDPSFSGVTLTIEKNGPMFRSLNGRLQIDSANEVRIKGSFDLMAAQYCTWGERCIFDPDSIDADTPRLHVVGVFQAVKSEQGRAVVYGD
ncbi:MAG: hypothetical protein R6U63_12295 [Longimicrobiales bacterium]